MGNRICPGGAGRGGRVALCKLARGVLCRDSSGCAYALDSEPRAGIRNVERTAAWRREFFTDSLDPAIKRGFLSPDLSSALFEEHPDTSVPEFLRNVWMVGAVHLASALSLAFG